MVLDIDIKGFGALRLEHLVLDLNGTLAVGGMVQKKLFSVVEALKEKVSIHLLSADTFGTASNIADQMKISLHVLKKGPDVSENEREQKGEFVNVLGWDKVVALGNGRNDVLMLKNARLGIAIIGEEGCAVETLNSADAVFTNPIHALKMLLNPQALKATLRM